MMTAAQRPAPLACWSPAGPKFYVVDQSAHKTFHYDDQFGQLNEFQLSHASPRGIATDPNGQLVWVVDSSRRVDVYNTSGVSLGSWTARAAFRPTGIASDGTGVWIVSAAMDRVYFYADGTKLRSGSHTADRSFRLHSRNRKPSGLAMHDGTLWVVDEKKDDPGVFVYDLEGTMLGQWDIDVDNSDPSGITIDPLSGDLWTVDRHDAVAYRYAEAASRRSGRQSAAGSLALDRSNRNPEGIADPIAPIDIGEVVSDSIATPTEVDQWQFDATAGQSIYIDFQQLSGGMLSIRLLAPDDTTLLSDSSTAANLLDNGPLTLADTGTYTLEVTGDGSATPAYQFQLLAVPDPVTVPIDFGEVVDGEIVVPGEVDLYTFNATAGQKVFSDMLAGGTSYGRWTLTDPNGIQVYSDYLYDHGVVELPQTGQYTLTVDGTGDRTGGYQFQLVAIPDPVALPIDIGDVVDGEIGVPGEVDLFTIQCHRRAEDLLGPVHRISQPPDKMDLD